MDIKEFKKRKAKLEGEILEQVLTLAQDAGVILKEGTFIYEGVRNEEGKHVVKPAVKIRYQI
jgi:hypothetical protein